MTPGLTKMSHQLGEKMAAWSEPGRFHKPLRTVGQDGQSSGVGVPTNADSSLGLVACLGERALQLGRAPAVELGCPRHSDTAQSLARGSGPGCWGTSW